MAMHIDNLSNVGRRYFKLVEFDEKEELLLEIRKHPFGLVGIYSLGSFVSLVFLLVFIGGALFIKDGALGETISAQNVRALLALIGSILTIFGVIGTAIGAYLYQGNVIFVTSEKIAQVLYLSIFNRKISQLSIGDIQDVTVFQKGFFARIFNYGTLVIETAGEQQNYTFTFTPSPYDCAKVIVGAQERSTAKFGN